MSDEFVHGVVQTDSTNATPNLDTGTATVCGFVGTATDKTGDDAPVTPLAFNTPVCVQRADELDALGLDESSYLWQAAVVGWAVAKRYFPIVLCRSQGGHTTGSGETAHTYTATDDLLTAIDALKGAEAATGYKPILLDAEGSTGLTVAARLASVGASMRAEAYVNAPNTYTPAAPNSTEKTGKDAAKAFATDVATSHAYVLWPSWKVSADADSVLPADTPIPASWLAMGLTVKVDSAEGLHVCPSNHLFDFSLFAAPLAPTSVVPFDMAPGSLANELNAAHVATFVYKSGWRLWGARTAAITPGTEQEQIMDAQYSFLSFRRVKNHYEDRIDELALAAVDKGITRNLGQYVTGLINREIRNDRGLLGGECTFTRLENPNDQIRIGRVKFTCKITPVYTAEKIVFEHEVSDKYLGVIFGD